MSATNPNTTPRPARAQRLSRSAFDLRSVLDTLVEIAARLCDANMSTILIRSGDLYRCASPIRPWLRFRIPLIDTRLLLEYPDHASSTGRFVAGNLLDRR